MTSAPRCGPRRETDLLVRLDERVFGIVILGQTAFRDAIDVGAIHLEGPADLVPAFPTWLGVTRFARYAVEAPRPSTPSGALLPA